MAHQKTKTIQQSKEANEQEFLSELLEGFKKWTEAGEKEYANAYKVLLNQFTNDDKE